MDPKDVLTEEESHALQQGGDDGHDSAQTGQSPEGAVRELHADHWERIVSDRVPALESVNERLVSMIETTGRELLRRPVIVGTSRGGAQRWGSYSRNLLVPTSLHVMQLQPMDLTGVLCLGPDFVFKLTDIFFGGPGTGQRRDNQINFTPMEERIVQKFIERVTRDLQEAWQPFISMDIRIAENETNPMFAKVASGSELFNVTAVEMTIGDCEIGFQILLPSHLVESVRHVRESGRGGGKDTESEKWVNRLKQDVADTRVSLRAVLAETRISLGDLTGAKPGDVIPTDIPGNVTIFAGDEPVLQGTFGVYKNRNAVRVSKAINRRQIGEKYGRV